MTSTAHGFAPSDLLADRAVADVAEGFRFLVDVTPSNIREARATFRSSGSAPTFEYRELEDDPELMAARIRAIPVDRVEDPTLSAFLVAKRRELVLQVDMLAARDTHDFVSLGIELYGTVHQVLLTEASQILEVLEPEVDPGPWIGPEEIAWRAEQELGHYRATVPDLEAAVEIREGTASLMVSNGDLLISPTSRISVGRIDALLHHEVGTHIVTHVNGVHQPLKVLASGLAGHDETQEGLAVLAEHLVGGLSGGRLRQLAARVVAVHQMLEGAEFPDVHADLTGRGFTDDQAFTIALRVFRSGGLTKDAVYLRGLRQLVDHLAAGGDLDPLWLGKMSLADAPLVADLRQRGLLVEPVLRPRFLAHPGAARRLSIMSDVTSLTQLVGSNS